MIQSALALATGSTGDLVTIWLKPKAAWAGVFLHYLLYKYKSLSLDGLLRPRSSQSAVLSFPGVDPAEGSLV